MNIVTTVKPSTLVTVEEAVDAPALGDDILLSAARAERTRYVGGSRAGAFQSHTARAWTMGGQVD